MIVLSYGGGTQTIAVVLLILEGKLPRPDMIVCADTGREASETWEYTERYIQPRRVEAGLTVEIAKHDLATVDAYRGDTLLVPAYTEHGKLTNFCSYEWKLRVVRRYLRSKGVEKCVNWLGISTDEVERIKPSDVQWCETQWPLCGMPVSAGFGVSMNRTACRQLVMNAGLPEPPKSSCYICPHRRNKQWQRLKMYYPEDFKKAVQFDEEIRAKDTRGGVWLHQSHKPLGEIDFEVEESHQPELFGCDSGSCWT